MALPRADRISEAAQRSATERALGDSALAGRPIFAGERKQVTVLFADLGGSLSAIEGVDPEDAEALLDTVVTAMMDAVHRFEGTVNQVLGDGIMALFGAPASHEDHAVRAACAALAMQAQVQQLKSESWAGRGLTPEIRVGLNSGEVVIRKARNDISVDYRAIGTTTHLAARMEQVATPGTIRMTEEVVRLGRGMLRARPLGAMTIRGLSQPVNTYELTGVAVCTRFQATLERGLSPLVGRESELATLRALLTASAEGRPSSVIVVGEPGIGKSRLCHELLRSKEASACRVLEASALSYARSTPHALLVGMLKSLFEIGDDDGPAKIRANVAAQFGALGLGEERLSVALQILDASDADEAWKRLDPVQRLRSIEQTVRDLLERWCGEKPGVIVLEDLHWADADSLSFVHSLLRAPPGARTLLLVTQRPEPALPWSSDADLHRCVLDPLALDEAQTLLQALVGGDESLCLWRRQLAERTQGNPFFIEESARAHAEIGLLEGVPGSYVLGSSAEEISVPAAVEAMIGARLDRLPAEALELLQAAAVIGDDSPIEVLLRVTNLPEPVFRERFAALTAADLLYRAGAFRTPVFRFRHALIRDVAYLRMLRARRRKVHGSVLDAFEELYPTRLGEHVERLAEHAYQAESWVKAVRYHQLACTRAASRWANAQAIAHLNRGLEILDRMVGFPGRDELAIDLRLIALAPLLPVGDHERVVAVLGEAEELARARHDAKRLAKIYSQLGTALWVTARYERAMEAAEKAQRLAVELGDFALATASRYSIGMIHHARGDLELALAALNQVIADLPGPLARRRLGWAGYPSVLARTFVISSSGLLGRFDQADRVFAEGRALAEELEHAYSLTMILEEYGFCQLVRGEIAGARDVLETAMGICRENEVLVMYAPIAARLGAALLECGERQAARALLEDALERGTHRSAAHYGLVYLLIALSDAELRTGDPERALETARRAEEVTRTAGERAYHVCALTQLADVLAGTPSQGQAALKAYDEALSLGRQLGMLPFQALSLQGKGAVLTALRDPESASVCFDAAHEIWQRLNAPARVRELEKRRTIYTATQSR